MSLPFDDDDFDGRSDDDASLGAIHLPSSERPLPPAQQKYWDSVETNAEILAKGPRRRGKGKDRRLKAGEYKGDRMGQSELTCRVANSIAGWTMVAGDVLVDLSGHEVSPGRRRSFFPEKTLELWGWERQPGDYKPGSWNGLYAHPDTPRRILLNHHRLYGRITAMLVTQRRLFIYPTAGVIRPSRTAGESIILSRVIGHAMRCRDAQRGDIVAVCLPRSEVFRKLAQEAREADPVQRAGLLILLVDRAGQITGLPIE